MLDAVQAVPRPTPEGRAAEPGLAAGQGGRPQRAVSELAWAPNGKLGHAEWLGVGRRLGAIGRGSQWWIGDWIRYGTSRWGEKYAEAARVTGYDVASLRNMAWVSSRFDSSLRNDKLTWSHHVLLAPLATEERRLWLDRACEEGLSVSQLRLELRVAKDAARSLSPSDDSQPEPVGAICPHCGHELRTSVS